MRRILDQSPRFLGPRIPLGGSTSGGQTPRAIRGSDSEGERQGGHCCRGDERAGNRLGAVPAPGIGQ